MTMIMIQKRKERKLKDARSVKERIEDTKENMVKLLTAKEFIEDDLQKLKQIVKTKKPEIRKGSQDEENEEAKKKRLENEESMTRKKKKQKMKDLEKQKNKMITPRRKQKEGRNQRLQT